jgi:hypothetical protein
VRRSGAKTQIFQLFVTGDPGFRLQSLKNNKNLKKGGNIWMKIKWSKNE